MQAYIDRRKMWREDRERKEAELEISGDLAIDHIYAHNVWLFVCVCLHFGSIIALVWVHAVEVKHMV